MRRQKLKLELQKSLKGKLPKNKLELLPNSYQQVGDIIILRLDKGLEKHSKLIGKAVLEIYKVGTVCSFSEISGEKRTPKIKVIAGNGTETVHKEQGCLFKLDVSKIMWSKGNVAEKGRIAKLVKPKETVVDMFAGIGYWSIPISKGCPSCRVFAIDKTPSAIKFLKENCRLNKVYNVNVIEGDCRKAADSLEGVADRVVMGWIFGTEKFLPAALKMLKAKGIIHYHFLCKGKNFGPEIKKVKPIAKENGYVMDKVLRKAVVKGYAPGVWHCVMDLKFNRSKSKG